MVPLLMLPLTISARERTAAFLSIVKGALLPLQMLGNQ